MCGCNGGSIKIPGGVKKPVATSPALTRGLPKLKAKKAKKGGLPKKK